MHPGQGAVDEAQLERLALAQSREAETQGHPAVGETGVVVQVECVPGLFGSAGDFEDALVEVGLPGMSGIDVLRALVADRDLELDVLKEITRKKW